MRLDDAAPLLAAVPEARRADCWWLIEQDGTPVAGDTGGVIRVLSELRLTRPLGRTLRHLHASRLLDVAYKRVSRNRGRLGRLVPDGPAPHRYP